MKIESDVCLHQQEDRLELTEFNTKSYMETSEFLIMLFVLK